MPPATTAAARGVIRMFGGGALLAGLCLPAAAQTTHRLSPPDATTFSERFSLLNGLRELSDGRVVVSDWLEERVAILDFAAGAAQPVGRVGGGPAEYRLPDRLLPFRGDSSVLVDLGNRRLAVIGPEGGIVRTVPVREPGAGSPGAIDEEGALFYVLPGWASGVPPGSADPLPLVRDARTGAGPEELARLDVSRPRSDAGQPRMTPGIPFVMFAPRDGWTGWTDGTIAIVRWAPYRIEWHLPDGTVRTTDPIGTRGEPVTEDDRFAFVRAFLERAPMSGRGADGGLGQSPPPSEQDVRAMVETNEFADEHGPFDPAAIRPGADGTLWVGVTPSTRSPATFDVYARGGSRTAQVTLPPGRTLLGVGRRHLYAVATDDLGLQRLERYPRPDRP